MVSCCILKCTKRTTRDKGIGFFRIPAVITIRCNKTLELSEERRNLWLQRIGRGNFFDPGIDTRVCSLHFVSGQPADLFDPTNVDWAPSLNLGHDESSSFPQQNHNTTVETQSNSMSRHGMFEYIAVPDAKRQRGEAVNMPECVDEELDLVDEDYELHSEIHIKEEPLSEEDEDEINMQAYMLSERLLAQQQVESRTSTPSPNALVMNLPESEAASSSNHDVDPRWDTRDNFAVSIQEEDGTSTHIESRWVTPDHLVIGMPENVNSSSTCHKSPWEPEATSPNDVIGITESINSSTRSKSPETVTVSPNRLAINIPEDGGKSTCLKSQVEFMAASPNRLVIHIPDEASSPRQPESHSVDIAMSPKPLVIDIPDEPSSAQRAEKPTTVSPNRLIVNIPDEANSSEKTVEDTVTVSVDDKVTVICTTPVPRMSPPHPPEGPPVDLSTVVPVEKKSKTWKFTVGSKSGQTKTCMITTTKDATPNLLSDVAIAEIATAVMDDKAPAVCNLVLNPDGTIRFLVDDSPSKEPVIRPCPISIVKFKNAQSKPEVSVKRLIKKPVFDSTNNVMSSKTNTIVTLNPNKPSVLKTRAVDNLSGGVTITSVKKGSAATYSNDRRRKQDVTPRISVEPVSKIQKIATKTPIALKPNTPQDEEQIKIVSYSGSQDLPNNSSVSTNQIKIAPFSGTIQQKIERLRKYSIPFQFPDSSAKFVCHICEEKMEGETATLSHIFQHCFVDKDNRRYSCNECKFECNSKMDLKVHSVKHDIFKFQCPHCKIYLLSDNQLKKHVSISHRDTRDQVAEAPDKQPEEEQKERKELIKQVTENDSTPGNIIKKNRSYSFFTNFICNLCLQKFKSKQALHLHAEAVHNDKVLKTTCKGKPGKGGHLQCHLCEFSTACSDNFYSHVLRHRGISAYFCNECNRCFESRSGFYKHCQTLHPHEFKYQNMWVEKDEVKQVQEGSNAPMIHLDSMEPTDEERRSKNMVIIVCNLCSQRFNAITKLYDHCVTMHGANKLKHFDEDMAPKSNYATLWRNRLAQYGIKGFMCKYCGKLWGYRHGVLIHQNIVHKKLVDEDLTGVQKYTCDICQKTSLNKHWLQNHINLKHLNPSHNQFSVFRQKIKARKEAMSSRRSSGELDDEKNTEPGSITQSTTETAEKVVEPVLENIVQSSTATKSSADNVANLEDKKVDDSQNTVEPKKVDGKSKSEQEAFDWAYWTSLGLRKSSRKRKKREFNDFIDYELADVSKRAEIFDICKGRRKWMWVQPSDNESPSSSDAAVAKKSPQLEEKLEDKTTPQETTDPPVPDDSKPAAVIKRKYVKNTLARKLRRKRSLVMKKKHYKKKIVLGALTGAKESHVVAGLASEVTSSNMASENTPVTPASEVAPSNLASEVAPSNMAPEVAPATLASEVAPPNLVSDITPPIMVSENTPTTLASEVAPSNQVSEVAPSVSLESVEKLSINKIPFKKRLSKIGSTENLQVETEHAEAKENQVQPEAVQNQPETSADMEKSGFPATDTVGDCETSALASADNSVITSEQSEPTVPVSENKESESKPEVETSLAEAGPESCGPNPGQESKTTEENPPVNKNVKVPTKRKINSKKTAKGKKKIKVQTSDPQTENVKSIPDASLRETVIKRTPEKTLTEAPSLEENTESTFVPDPTEKPMPILEPEVLSQPTNTVLESPVTCSPSSLNSSPITPVSMRKSARERKKKDFVDFVQISNRRSKPNAVEANVTNVGHEKVESPLLAEGKDISNTKSCVNPVSENSSPAVNLKRSRKPSLKLKGVNEPATPEASPKPVNRRSRKSNVNTEVKPPEVDSNIETQPQKKGRKSNINAEVKMPELGPNIDTPVQKKGRKSNINAEVKMPELGPNIDTPVQKKGRKSKINAEVKTPEVGSNTDTPVQKKGRKSNVKAEEKIKKGKKSETTPAVATVCERKEETTELADASFSVAITETSSPTTETQNPDLSSPIDSVPQETVQCNGKESVESPKGPTTNASETSNSPEVNRAESSNGPLANETESPSSTPTINTSESPNGPIEITTEDSNGLATENQNGPTVNETENQNGPTVNETENQNGPTVNETENQNGPTVNETESLNSPTVNAADSPGLVSSVEETITNLDPKQPQTAVTPKRAKVSKSTEPKLSDSVRKSSRPRKKREITDFEFL